MVGLGDVVKEEVELLTQGVLQVCFSRVYSHAPSEGQIHSVALELMVIEDFKTEEMTSSVSRIGNGLPMS